MNTTIITAVASGPATAIVKSSPGVSGSRSISVSPPNRYRSIRSTPTPRRRAATACPSSWTMIDANSASTLTTVVRYATVSELCRVVRNGPDNR